MRSNLFAVRSSHAGGSPAGKAASRVDRVLSELDALADDLKIGCAEASLDGDLARIERLLSASRSIVSTRTELNTLRALYPNTNKQDEEQGDGRGRQTRLRIIVSGTVIEEARAKDSVVEALRLMGFDRVARLGKTLRGNPLVSRTKSLGQYDQALRDGWYVTVHSSTDEKRKLLESIGAALGVPIVVEII